MLGCGGALWGDGDREARRMMLLGLTQAALHSRLARPVLGAPGERLYRRTARQQPGAHWPAQESSLVGALLLVLLLLLSAATGVPVVQVQVQVQGAFASKGWVREGAMAATRRGGWGRPDLACRSSPMSEQHLRPTASRWMKQPDESIGNYLSTTTYHGCIQPSCARPPSVDGGSC